MEAENQCPGIGDTKCERSDAYGNQRWTRNNRCVMCGEVWTEMDSNIDSFTPRWNEQYTWEVFHPCTVVTIGVFDNCHLHGGENKNGGAKDSRVGKVRIWLSTLETDRVYTHTYPLLGLHPNGVKKMREIHFAVRFTCSALLNLMYMYSLPLLPKMTGEEWKNLSEKEKAPYDQR
uniref:C2 domain-containing protein n=1 Tax=Noccaea caerulescens TaxID=107243 RepID=A0A1J3F323_NOCCA